MEETKGIFFDALTRNNKKIKTDRAQAIAEDTQLIYKREIEDLDVKLKRLKRDRENMLDLSPENSQSLIPAANFNEKEFVMSDIDLGIKIRNTEIRLEIATKQYKELFGG